MRRSNPPIDAESAGLVDLDHDAHGAYALREHFFVARWEFCHGIAASSG
jgi:hypothetical protein